MELARPGERECYGVGIDGNIVTASIRALVSGVNRMDIAAAGSAHQAA
jgi:2-isopropylmalate synthase